MSKRSEALKIMDDAQARLLAFTLEFDYKIATALDGIGLESLAADFRQRVAAINEAAQIVARSRS